MTTPTKTQRWLDLISFLVRRRFPVAVEDIMNGVPAYTEKWTSEDETDRNSVRRMFERDKDELRELGIPLETVPYSIDFGTRKSKGYQLASRDFYLPYLRIVRESPSTEAAEPRRDYPRKSKPIGLAAEVELEREHAETAIDALRRIAELPGFGLSRDARSALRKLAFDLDVDDMGEVPVLYVDPPGADELRERMALLTEAVQNRKKVRFRYHGIYRGEPTERDVAPYGLLFQQGQWYLIGHDALRDDRRVFRLGRMEDIVVNAKSPKTPDYEVPADFDLSTYAGREPWELGDDDATGLHARVRFEFPASLWAARNDRGTLVEDLPGGGAVREFELHQPGPFLRWLQSFGGEAVVIAPEELREEQVSLARQTAGLYGEAAGE